MYTWGNIANVCDNKKIVAYVLCAQLAFSLDLEECNMPSWAYT